MRFTKILAAAISVTFLTAFTAFAAPGVEGALNAEIPRQKSEPAKQKCDDFEKDPIKVLQSKKEKVQSLYKEGKISKEKADAIIARIDSKIKEIREFDSLNLQQKKDKLINDFKASIDKRVKEGKLTKEKADTIVKDFTDKITKWDGNGYPQFHGKWFKGKGKHHSTDKQLM